VVGTDLGAPGAIAFFQTKGLDRAMAGEAQPVRRAGGEDRVIEPHREFDLNMQLVTELTDIGDAERKQQRAMLRPGPAPSRRETRGAGDVVSRQRLQYLARLRAREHEHGSLRRRVNERCIRPGRDRRVDPVEVARCESGSKFASKKASTAMSCVWCFRR